jgi:TonB family protein
MRNHTIIAFLFALFIHAGIFLLIDWPSPSNEKTQLIIPSGNRTQVLINDFSLAKKKDSTNSLHNKAPSAPNKAIELPSAPATDLPAKTEGTLKSLNFSRFSAPLYPRFAREKGLEGSVSISASFNELGSITEVKILKSSGPKAFDQSVLDAAKTWKIETDHAGNFEKNFEFKLNN